MILLATAFALPATAAELTRYDDAPNGYSIGFPADWKTRTDGIVAVVAAPSAVLGTAGELPNVKVVSKTMIPGFSIDDLTAAAKQQWTKLWKIESEQAVKIGGLEARQLVLEQTIGPLKTKVLKAFIVGGDNYYIVSCASTVADFASQETVCREIIGSFAAQ
jgi:hypothetical protein